MDSNEYGAPEHDAVVLLDVPRTGPISEDLLQELKEVSTSIDEKELIKKIDDLERKNWLTLSPYRAMVAVWMLAVALASAGFIWYGMATWDDPVQSILNIGMGIWLILLAMTRIVRKEIEIHGSSKKET